jgi:hypothetical protein
METMVDDAWAFGGMCRAISRLELGFWGYSMVVRMLPTRIGVVAVQKR